MLKVFQLSLEVLNSKSKAFGLEVNWSQTKLQYASPDSKQPVTVDVCNAHVEVVDSLVHCTESSESEISVE